MPPVLDLAIPLTKNMINILLKSAFLFLQQRRSLPQALNLFVTSRCNARCSFCLYKDQVNSPMAAKEELRLEEIVKIARSYGKLHYLAISGGEPFIRDDIDRICQAFIDHCDTKVIDIPSNFSYGKSMIKSITEIVRKNPGTVLDMQLSLDNIDEKHDESRQVPGLYKKAIENFNKLKELQRTHGNLRLKINVLYLDENKNNINEIFRRIVEDFKFDRIQLTYPTCLVGHDMEQNRKLLSEIEDFIKTESELDSHFSFLHKKDLYTSAMRAVKEIYHEMLLEVPFKRNMGAYCEAGKIIAVINEKGDVFPCEPLWHKIANLRDHSYNMPEVLALKEMKDFRSSMLGEGKCNCTWGCTIHSHISVNPAYLPRLGWIALKKMLAS